MSYDPTTPTPPGLTVGTANLDGRDSDQGPQPGADETFGLTARQFDPAVPHPARIYAYWLGSKDYYPADRKAAEEVAACRPQVVAGARANRAFLARSVRCLAGQCGIGQFLDIGPGLPAPLATHEVAQAIPPNPRSSTLTATVSSRVVHIGVQRCRAVTGCLEGCFALGAGLLMPRSASVWAARGLAAGDPGSPPVLARTWHVSLPQASSLLAQLILGKVPESRPQHRGAGSLPVATVYEHTFDLSRASRNVRSCATGRGEIDEYRTDSHHQ